MEFVETGNRNGKTLMLLPGTCCNYQTNFGAVLDSLVVKYHLICVNYDGFDGSGTVSSAGRGGKASVIACSASAGVRTVSISGFLSVAFVGAAGVY